MLDEILNELKNPSGEFSPIPFWFINDRPKKAELRRQMQDFCDKGVNGVVIHPRIGFPQDFEYLSEEYFDIIKFIAETAKELDMKLVLYDEAMYPSGSAHGEVVRSNPDFASVGIKLTENPQGGKVIASFDDGYYIVSQKCGGTIRGIHYGEDDGEENAPLSADILNPDAVDKFIELTHERYYKHIGEYFSSTVIGFFTDEPCILGRGTRGFFEWTDGLEKEITARGGKLSELRALFDREENETTAIYRKLITDRLNETYYKKLSDWCASHNIALMGHPKESDDIDEQRYFHIPGQDLIFRRVSPEWSGVDGMDSVQAKCSSDAARHMGKRRNSSECFGACSRDGLPWYFTAEDMKWYIDWLGVRGVNLFIPHAFYYSIEGKRKDERPPDVGPNNGWWKHYRLFSDYMKRISYIMTDSKNCAKTAVLCKSGDMKPNEVKAFYETQTEFNYLPYSLLENAEVKNHRLTINGYEYEYVMGDGVPDAEHIESSAEIKTRDFYTDESVKALRVSHIVKNGVDMYFLVNEGNEDINTGIEMRVSGTPVAMDLWRGEYYGLPFETGDRGVKINLSLEKHESVLILFDKNDAKYPHAPEKTLISLKFKLLSEDKEDVTKTYAAEYEKHGGTENEYFRIKCEEWAECYVNGAFAEASFFGGKFDIGKYLKEGRNEIKLVVKGSIANKYSGYVPYGIEA